MEHTLNEKLAIMQTELKANKSRYNSFGKYNFRSAEDILESIKPFLLRLGVTVTVNERYLSDAVIESTAIITDGVQKIKATSIVCVDLEQKGMAMPQRFGSASSYGKKYALGNLFLIDDTQDADATNKHEKEEKPKLHKDTPNYKKVVDAITKGYSIDDIKTKYILDKQIQAELEQLNSRK
jgi:hypothetical protein